MTLYLVALATVASMYCERVAAKFPRVVGWASKCLDCKVKDRTNKGLGGQLYREKGGTSCKESDSATNGNS